MLASPPCFLTRMFDSLMKECLLVCLHVCMLCVPRALRRIRCPCQPLLQILPSYAHGMANHKMHRNRLRALLLTLHGLAMCPFLLYRSIRPPFRLHHAQRKKCTKSRKAKRARGTRSVSARLACFGTSPQWPARIAQQTLSPIRKYCRQCGPQSVRACVSSPAMLRVLVCMSCERLGFKN